MVMHARPPLRFVLLVLLTGVGAVGCGGNLTVDLGALDESGGREGSAGDGDGAGGGNQNGNADAGPGTNSNDNTNDAHSNDNGNGNGANENGNDNADGGNDNDNGNDNIPLEGCPTPLCGGVCCDATESCVAGTCEAPLRCDTTDLCGTLSPFCCPADRPVCVFERFCQAACDAPSDARCGANGEICCASGFVCGDSLRCERDCAQGSALCGTGTPESFGTVCCDAGDECVFDQCVTPGTACETFLDCADGEYCEQVLDEDPDNPDPTRGLCLPDEFPDDVPVCQARPDDILLPQTEWRWVGLEIRGSPGTGAIVPECEDASDTNCYLYPCTDYFDQSTCYKNVLMVPMVADLDRAVDAAGERHPEVVLKAYRDGEDSNGLNGPYVLAVLDGRDGSNRVVAFDDRRGHVAVGNLDDDPQLEIVSASQGLRGYEPFPDDDPCPTRAPGDCETDSQCRLRPSGCEAAQMLEWVNTGDGLNQRLEEGAPALTDLNGDGQTEVIYASRVIDGATGTQHIRCAADRGSAGGQRWYISVVADVNLDGRGEIIAGDTAYTPDEDSGAWSCPEKWTATRRDGTGADALGPGYAGVGNFIDNQRWPFAPGPRPACEGRAPNDCTGVCAVDGATCTLDTAAACATLADESSCNDYIACRWEVDACIEDTAETAIYPVDRDYPEVSVTADGALYIVHGATGRVMPSPVDGETPLEFAPFTERGGAPNVADFDGDGRVEVSYAGTGCMAVFDVDCAVGSANRRLGIFDETECDSAPRHPVCDLCANDANDPTCLACRADGTAEPCISLPPGCQQSPRASHPNLDGGDYACTDDTNPGVIRDMIGMLWMRPTQDASSAATGTSVFDFQGDGKAEVLYGDECFFRVYNGETGSLIFERPNSNRTATEYPTVVDVDGDGRSEILTSSNGDRAAGRDDCAGSGNAFRTGLTRDGDPYELYTPAFCDCGNYNLCAGLDAGACAAEVGCAWDGVNCGLFDCESTYGVSGECNADRACRWNEGNGVCEVGTLHPQAQCTLADGCVFDEGSQSCGPVDCDALDSDLLRCASVVGCEVSGTDCRQSPQHPEFICDRGTWGVTVIGDTRDQWVTTLPQWHQHSYHVTEVTRDGQPVADWGERPNNWQVYNNFRQNVQGFVPLNAPDLQVFSFNASLANCPPEARLVARVVNRGRAGVAAGTPVSFFVLGASGGELIGTVGLPYALLPGQGANVEIDYVLEDFGDPGLSLAFQVVANPSEGFEPVFECDGDNNTATLSGLSCLDSGG